MKLTCHITPNAERQVYFDEAASLYSWTSYDIEVISPAFRDYAGVNAILTLNFSGTAYATVNLRYDATRRDRRVGTVNLVNDSFTTLYNLLKANSGTDAARYNAEFQFSIVMASDGAPVADSPVNVVVMPFQNSGYASSGGRSTDVDAVLDGTSANPLQNAVIAQKFEQIEQDISDIEENIGDEVAARQTLAASLQNHVNAPAVHVTAEDKTRWNSAVYVTQEQKDQLASFLSNPLGSATSFDSMYARVNAVVELLASVMGVQS